MTTGRINQVAIFFPVLSPVPSAKKAHGTRLFDAAKQLLQSQENSRLVKKYLIESFSRINYSQVTLCKVILELIRINPAKLGTQIKKE
jgi:tRNA U55 pseudouridine synthase TruB